MIRRLRVHAPKLTVLMLGLCLGLEGEVQSQDGGIFRRIDLRIGGRVTEVLTPDLNGDGRLDLLVIRGREALVFFQESNGDFPSFPAQRFRFHPRTILFDVGDVDGDGKAEIALLQKRGVFVYRLRERKRKGQPTRLLFGLRPEKLVMVESFFSRAIKKEVRRKEFLRDVDADGDLDLFVPLRDGFAVVPNQGQGRFGGPTTLPAPPTAILNLGRSRLSSQVFASYWFPNPNVTQWDATGAPEVVMARDGQVAVFKVPEGGGALPTQSLTKFTIPDQKQFSMQVENPLELDFTLPILIRDLNKDGRVDVSATHVGKGTTRIYMNKGNGAKDFAEPAASVRVKGVTFLAYYADMDGDGLDDLILPRMDKIGAWAVIKAFLTRSVPIEMYVFYQRPDATFPDEPDDTRDLEIPVSINTGGDRIKLGSTVVASIDGDYDGDGLSDLLYRTDSDTLSFYRGRKNRIMSEDSWTEAQVPNVEDYRFALPTIADLNGDGRSDVVLRYWSWDRDDDRLTLLVTKGR